jgi:hypothetical protein
MGACHLSENIKGRTGVSDAREHLSSLIPDRLLLQKVFSRVCHFSRPHQRSWSLLAEYTLFRPGNPASRRAPSKFVDRVEVWLADL